MLAIYLDGDGEIREKAETPLALVAYELDGEINVLKSVGFCQNCMADIAEPDGYDGEDTMCEVCANARTAFNEMENIEKEIGLIKKDLDKEGLDNKKRENLKQQRDVLFDKYMDTKKAQVWDNESKKQDREKQNTNTRSRSPRKRHNHFS